MDTVKEQANDIYLCLLWAAEFYEICLTIWTIGNLLNVNLKRKRKQNRSRSREIFYECEETSLIILSEEKHVGHDVFLIPPNPDYLLHVSSSSGYVGCSDEDIQKVYTDKSIRLVVCMYMIVDSGQWTFDVGQQGTAKAVSNINSQSRLVPKQASSR
ncbi:hypothetical protein KQX54_017591 [Cotesia glomerata]|uniref:Uncharacterized protein n=1 Tax=Cotesia glomerata TaxID=32391 RepID=A0AAV7IEF0_COTGL|nr:hypothetical protein KQX54_017591 [Cotesia glomerata]